MISGFLVALREGLEIALVLALIVAHLRKSGNRHQLKAVWGGSGVAVAICVAGGLLFNWLVGDFEGKWEQFIEGTLALAAALVLTWMIFWMRGHARGVASELHRKIDAALEQSALAIAVVAFTAVAREGFETVLFLLGAETSSDSGSQVFIGGVIGLAVAAVLGFFIFLGSDRISLAKFFNWTGLLLILFAAGLFAKSVHEFRELFELEAGWYAAPLWTIASGPFASGWTYDFLNGFFGWSSDPERVRVVAYLAYLLPTLVFYFRGTGRKLPTTTATKTATVTRTPDAVSLAH